MKLKFIAITLAVSALVACSPSKKEKVTDDGAISARTPETENLLANLKKYHPAALCSVIMTTPTMASAGKAMKGVPM